MKRKNTQKKIMLLVCLAALLGLAFRFCYLSYLKVETTVAQLTSVRDSVNALGVAVRDEALLENDLYNRENLKYFLNDGERIAKNGVIAEIYADPQIAKAHYKIENLNKEIKTLEKLNLSRYNISNGINFVNDQINDEITSLLTFLYDKNVSESQNNIQNISYLLNERQIVLGQGIDFQSQIDNLNKEKEKLLESDLKCIDVLKSPKAGVFMATVDGFENKINYESVLNSDFNDFNFEDFNLSSNQTNTSSIFGKIIKSETWYIICQVADDKFSKFKKGDFVKADILSFDFVSSLPFKIESVIEKINSKNSLVVLSCDYMNKDLARIRKEEFQIILNEYDGFKVPKSAIRKLDGESNFFVYVKTSGHLKLKRVNPIFWDDSYAVCSYSSSEMLDENYLQIGDKIVVKGSNLYENKHVE